MTTMNPLRSLPWRGSVTTGLFSRRSAAGADTNGSAVRFVAFFFLAISVCMTLASGPVEAADGFQQHWYGGFGIGISRLEPDPDTTIYFNEETRSRGGKLLLGYDWSKRFSVEAYYADLGEARIGSTEPAVPGGDIGYKDYGLSALYYLFKQRDSHRGLAFFLRAGAGKMENKTELPYRRLNDTHLLLGAGFQYGFANGVALRSDLDLYDADSRLVTIGLLSRFGWQGAEEPLRREEPSSPVVSSPAPTAPSPLPSSAPAEEKVKLGELGTVYFATDSAELDKRARAVLDEVASELLRVPGAIVEVEGHTDSRGTEAYNQALSERRARAVIDYLTVKGIEKRRLVAKAHGERRPVASNDTARGRQLNRRVELHERK